MKKFLIMAAFVAAFGAALAVGQGQASAESAWQNTYWNNYCARGHFGSGCKGYFSGAVDGCMYALAFGVTNSGCNTGQVLTGGINVGSGNAFVSTIQGALNGGNTENRCGAAFIIAMMLGHGPFGSNCNAGVTYARNNFNTWRTLVLSYANSTNPAYGVRWNVLDNPTVNSTYFFDTNDEVFHSNVYHCTPSNGACGGRWADEAWTGWRWTEVDISLPVIQFYWPGGSFELERGCANLVGGLGKLPQINQKPTGSISLHCDQAASQEYALVQFTDPDAPTTGYIGLGSWRSGSVGSGGGLQRIDIPQSAMDPYNPQRVDLYVIDSGPGGSGTASSVANANTVACVTLACGSLKEDPDRLDPYTQFSATATVTNSVGKTPSGASMSLSIVGSGFSYGPQSAPATGSGSVSSATFNTIGPTSSPGVYTATWTLTAGTLTKTCTDTIAVSYLPYLSIYGGDVAVGASPTDASGTCAVNTNAGVYSWNKDGGSSGSDFSGGGAQYAVQALAQIMGFASAASPSNNTPPLGLSLANTSADPAVVNPSQGLFGGFYGASASDCDFTSDITVSATNPGTIAATALNPGDQKVIYIKNHDVYISGNITYNGTGGWASIGDIPYFKLVVVGGDIYIGSGVGRLDGLYVAEPSGGSGGAIYTCASGIGAPANPRTDFAACNNKLTITGAFVAKQVQFLRTRGSVGQASSSDTVGSSKSAEVFQYTPELWLPRGNSAPNSGYDAITSLPPVL